MVDRAPKLFDVVALLRDLPSAGLRRGQVGTVVDENDSATVLVEFADNDGRTYAAPSVARQDLLVLNYEPVAAE
ncbi:MAG: DUF4926 domain-containing protein [Alphaproteobacteria bacterium]|nr:DUF4926 domain-containing protein [Alphaproteobacteria bacterium]